MPKKRTYNFKPLQGSSLSSTPKQHPSNTDGTPSVNERLSELRKLEGKDAAAKKRQLADSVNQRSVPPDVRGILGVPESAPPRPKGIHARRERMRTPGPAPPRSWLAGASGASAAWTSRKNSADRNARGRPKFLLRFARLAGLERDSVVDARPSSLVHLALKAIAEAWDLLDAEDYPALADVPLRLRLRLISYIDFYGSGIDLPGLQALLQGIEEVTSLDLAGFVGYRGFTLRKLGKLLEQAERPDPAVGDDSFITEAWDAEDSSEAALLPSLRINRFSNLTHLCLSHPAGNVSWRDLLAFSKQTAQVTHLSLAYWPRPTLTPNLATATVSSAHSPDVHAGGSHYYSALDKDMSEPASLLRQLSGNLLCLQWLDLEGCEEWIPALGKLATDAPAETFVEEEFVNDGWTAKANTTLPAFVSTWKNLKYLRCSQGWLPRVEGIRGLAERRETVIDALLVEGITKHLRLVDDPSYVEQHISQDELDVEKKKARIWLEREYAVTYASMRINSSRRSYGLRPLEMDFGWIQRHAAPAT